MCIVRRIITPSMSREMYVTMIVLTLFGHLLLSNATCWDEECAQQFIEEVDREMVDLRNVLGLANWAYDSNITDFNLKRKLKVSAAVAEKTKQISRDTQKFKWQDFEDQYLRRQFKFYSKIGSAALSEDKRQRLEIIKSEMKKIYSTATICIDREQTDCGYPLEPDIVKKFANVRDPEVLRHMWVFWRNAVGPKVKKLFQEYVDLSNEAARLNNFTDHGESWLDGFEDPNFRDSLRSLWIQVQPLYLQIHAYVRYHLRKKYGDIVSETGPIPVHLLGNMWGQSWGALSDFTIPYPNQFIPDISKELKKQGYTPLRIFETAENFFTSINLTAMPESFWERSLLEKPKGRDVICHASAWDLFKDSDVRIKQCTEVTLGHFITAHHEMGHIEYYLQYKDLPVIFRRGANSGFHEAVGDTVSLSVRSSKYLRRIGLLEVEENEHTILNHLFGIGLDKIVFLPYGYLMDLWRGNVFSGRIKPENYNCEWWKLREEFQGIEPPVDRSEHDFDPASKYHVVADVPYIRYFVSYILQFQFHRSLCTIANQYSPESEDLTLQNCDIYGNTDAGNAFKKMLSLGRSIPWQDALETLTKQRTIDASGLLEYFKPLHLWLQKENEKNGAYIGWTKSEKKCNSRT